MYVCVCNALNEKAVQSAIDAGAMSCCQVHALHGKRPQCGSCQTHIMDMIRKTADPEDCECVVEMDQQE